ncbi:unnamed protein product [Symbiodinium sp. CCMP2592]|nr:unnamed protein product [Symbiodinium sp. CCMP2592]
MAKFASLENLHTAWLRDREIAQRLDAGGRLVRSYYGLFVSASELHCVHNKALLTPYMIRQRREKTLDIPDVESLKSELKALYQARLAQKEKHGKKQPKAVLEASMALVEGNCHLDAKTMKRLLSYARARFLKQGAKVKNPDFAILLSYWGDEDKYPKGGKCTRWSCKEVEARAEEDEAAGLHDAMQEGYEGEEEEDWENDEVVEPPCVEESHAEKPPSKPVQSDGEKPPSEPMQSNAEKPPSEPVQSHAEKPPSKPMQSHEKPGVIHTDSSRSIGSLASSASLATTVLETPDPKHKCFSEAGNGQITPSPPSLPVLVKEVLLVVDSPKKVIKQEPVDKTLADVLAETDAFDREAALRELAKLEAELLHLETSRGKPDPSQISRRELAWSNDNDETQVATESQITEAMAQAAKDKTPERDDMEKEPELARAKAVESLVPVVVTREDQLLARQQRKAEAEAKKLQQKKDKEEKELKKKEKENNAHNEEIADKKTRRTAAKSKAKKQAAEPKEPPVAGDECEQGAEGEEPTPSAPACGGGRARGGGRGRGGRGRGGRGQKRAANQEQINPTPVKRVRGKQAGKGAAGVAVPEEGEQAAGRRKRRKSGLAETLEQGKALARSKAEALAQGVSPEEEASRPRYVVVFVVCAERMRDSLHDGCCGSIKICVLICCQGKDPLQGSHLEDQWHPEQLHFDGLLVTAWCWHQEEC